MVRSKWFNWIKGIFIVIAIVHFISTFFTDKLYFNPITLQSEHIVSFILCKILLFIVLTLFWQFIYQISFGKNKYLRQIFKYAMVYFVPMMLLLIVIWPGPIADGDIPYFMNHEVKYSYNYYLHYLTSLVHIIGLMVFPFLTGIIIFQSFCYSLIVGYIINRAICFFNSKLSYLIYLIFLIPSIAYFSLYINRTPIYGYIYLLFLSILIFDFLEHKNLTIKKFIYLTLMAAILSVLRYEGVYLILTTPIMMTIAYRLKSKVKSVLLLILSIIICINIINIPQKRWENKYLGNYTHKRLIPAIVHSISNMLQYNITGDFDTIDKVVSVDIMREYADIHNITPLGAGAERTDYTAEEGKAFVKESFKIFLTNLPEFLKVRFETLNVTALYNKDTIQNFDYFKENYFVGKSLFVDELFPKARKITLKILVNNPNEGEFSFASTTFKAIGDFKNIIFYNLYIPIGILVAVLIASCIKRNWFWIFLTLGTAAHVSLIFLLAPATFFMYYVPINIIGWFVGILFIISFLTKFTTERKVSLFEKI